MATIKKMKKAQDGDNLRKGQYKRIGRIAEKNPERAERVASRMNERASRVERGKDIASGSGSGSLSDKSARKYAELKSNPYMESAIRSREKEFTEEYNKLSKRKPINLGGTSKPGMQKSPVLDYRMYKKGENPFKRDEKGNVIKQKSGGKTKMKNGGSLSGLKAGTKRVGPVDPKGAYTKVQKKTLAGAKGKASLVKDKQLGATKMRMGGKSKKR